jgi:hypothetical protein
VNDNIIIVFLDVRDVTDRISDVFDEVGNANDKVSDVNDSISIIYVTTNTGSNIIKKPSISLEGFILYNVNLVL